MKCEITVTQRGYGWTKVVEKYCRSFRSKSSLYGFLLVTEEQLNDGPGLKCEVTAEPVEKTQTDKT